MGDVSCVTVWKNANVVHIHCNVAVHIVRSTGKVRFKLVKLRGNIPLVVYLLFLKAWTEKFRVSGISTVVRSFWCEAVSFQDMAENTACMGRVWVIKRTLHIYFLIMCLWWYIYGLWCQKLANVIKEEDSEGNEGYFLVNNSLTVTLSAFKLGAEFLCFLSFSWELDLWQFPRMF